MRSIKSINSTATESIVALSTRAQQAALMTSRDQFDVRLYGVEMAMTAQVAFLDTLRIWERDLRAEVTLPRDVIERLAPQSFAAMRGHCFTGMHLGTAVFPNGTATTGYRPWEIR